MRFDACAGFVYSMILDNQAFYACQLFNITTFLDLSLLIFGLRMSFYVQFFDCTFFNPSWQI